MGSGCFKDTFRYLFISELRLETWRLCSTDTIIWSSHISCSVARPSGTFCEINQPQLPGAWSVGSKCFKEGAQIFQTKKIQLILFRLKCPIYVWMRSLKYWTMERKALASLASIFTPNLSSSLDFFLAWSVSSSKAYGMCRFISYMNDSNMKNKTKQV